MHAIPQLRPSSTIEPRETVLLVATVLLVRSLLTIFGHVTQSWFVQCDDVSINAITYFLGLLAPWVISALLLFCYSRKPLALLVGALGFLLLPVTLITAFWLVWLAASFGVDHSCEPTKSIAVAPLEKVVVYRTDGGATTDFGVMVIEEFAIFPGLKLVHPLVSAYNASDADVQLQTGHKLHCKFKATGDHVVPDKTVSLI